MYPHYVGYVHGEKGESVNHIVCECKKLAQREYKQRHDNVTKVVHWELCEKYHLEKKDKWYEHWTVQVKTMRLNYCGT